MMRKKFIFFLLILCAGLTGCASTKAQTENNSPVEQYHVWISQTAVIEIEEARIGSEEIYLKYHAFSNDTGSSRIFYGHAQWDPQINPKINLSKNVVVPLELITKEQWIARSTGFVKVKALDETKWGDFRTRLIHRLAPDEAGQGAVVRSDEEELFLYYDSEGHLQMVELKDKPRDVELKDIYGPQQITEIVVEEFRSFLDEIGESASQVILPTFHYDHVGAFVYLDLDKQLAMSLNLEEKAGQRYKENLIKKGIKSADLLIVDSHILGMVTRPFSSTFKLLTWTKDVAYDVVNPTKLKRLENTPPPALYQGEGMDLEEWERRLDALVKKKPAKGTMKYLIGGDQFFPHLIDQITRAKEMIDVRIFIFDNDDYAVKIADLLKKKSSEGVRVRVLLDGMGVVMGEGKVPEDLPAGFKPPDSMMNYLTKDSKVQVRVRPNTWFKADHIKTIVIDHTIGYTGGMNIGREYRYHWQDMMIALEGPIISDIVKEFNLAWEHAGTFGDIGYVKALFTPKPNVEYKGFPIRMLYTRLNDPQIFKTQIAAIKNAKKYIYISNAYFSDNAILYELINARRRGVDVRVILPVNGNHEIMNKSNRLTANIMLKHKIRVFFYPGMSHIKAAVYDGWLCTGTANFDKLSFRDNLELNLATSDPDAVERFLDELFYPDFQKSREMTELLNIGLKEYFAEFLAEQL